MRRKLKISDIFIPKKILVGDKEIPPMSCSNNGIFPRELKFKKKLSKSLSKNKVASKGDFIFGLSRQILNFGMMQYDIGCFSSAYKVYECKYSYEFSRFLELYMRENHNYFYQCIDGGAREGQTISEEILFSLEILVPSDDEIKAIVNLDEVFKKKLTFDKKINRTLEKISKKLFRSWFIDFDPVKSKVEKVTSDFSKEINNLFPGSFEDSKLGKIPKGWEITKLKSIINIFGGHAFKSRDYVVDGVFVLRTKNFDGGIAKNLSDDVFLPKNYLEIYKDFICEAFDYHLVMVGASIGKTGMILPNLLPALRNQNMWCFRPKNEELISRFYTKFTVDVLTNKLMSFASGSARDFFRREIFKEHQLVLPSKKILKFYSEITNLILKRIALNHKKMILLSSLKKILISKFISGKLKITDAEKIISEVST